ncbi:MAG: membrane dipeptidase [Acidobacteria bacterium]|nr:membrane dipeptidase [Acidobacteriota bacterium]
MTRSQFIRLAGLCAVERLIRPGASFAHSSADEAIEALLAESFVMDGNVNLGMRRGRGYSPLEPGAIKRLTGLSAGNHTVRPESMDSLSRRVEANQKALLKVERASDFDLAAESGRYGVVFYMQGGFDLKGSVEPLAQWKAAGLRVLQLTMDDNALGGGTAGDDRPLTEFGKRVVRELNRLRMIVDVSHSGRRTTLDAAAASSRPITANHVNVEALTPHLRNKSDEELKAIAATGGVVAATNINRYLIRDPRRPATMDDFVSHVEYVVEKIGIDHVGISSDSYMDGSQRYDVDYSDQMMSSAGRWKHVTRKLAERGYSTSDLKKILGLNFRRVYERVLDP